MRLDIRKTGQIKDGEVAVGTRAKVKVVKNKEAPPFREAEFELRFGEGINALGELIDLGAASGLVDKSGAWFSLDGERIGQGRDKACEWQRQRPEVAEVLRSRLLSTARERREIPLPAIDGAVAEAA